MRFDAPVWRAAEGGVRPGSRVSCVVCCGFEGSPREHPLGTVAATCVHGSCAGLQQCLLPLSLVFLCCCRGCARALVTAVATAADVESRPLPAAPPRGAAALPAACAGLEWVPGHHLGSTGEPQHTTITARQRQMRAVQQLGGVVQLHFSSRLYCLTAFCESVQLTWKVQPVLAADCPLNTAPCMPACAVLQLTREFGCCHLIPVCNSIKSWRLEASAKMHHCLCSPPCCRLLCCPCS